MAGSGRRKRWLPAPVKGGLGLALAWWLFQWAQATPSNLADKVLGTLALWGVGSVIGGRSISRVLWECGWHVGLDVGWATFLAVLAAATVLVPLGYLTRLLARARVRGGGADPLDRVRVWAGEHPRRVAWLTAAPALLWAARVVFGRSNWWLSFGGLRAWLVSAEGVVMALLAATAVYALTRAGVRSMLAPTLDEAASPDSADLADKKDIVFRAVAVTRRTRAAIGVVAALSAVASAVFFLMPVQTLNGTPAAAGLAAFVAFVLGSAVVFRRSSLVAVGVDGVLVMPGTASTHFVAYRDLDDARAAGESIELVREGVVLRLQLHGEDAAKRDAVIAKIRAAIARAKQGASAVAGQIVASATSERLARTARGDGGEYRAPALTRDQLWDIVEAPEVDAAARTAAATALATTDESGVRARLRVAAEQIADPDVRVALREIAEGDDAPDEEARPARRIASR
jgi:hypothetical protein